MRTKTASLHFTLALIAASMSLASCEGLPGEKKHQGAVIGGASGAAAGAIIAGEDNRLLGAVIGTALGAGAGYVVGNEISEKDRRDAQEAAAQKEKTSTFTVEDVRRATTADIDGDGNVTMAELVAMQRASLGDPEIIRRLEATDVVFDLTDQQKQTLREEGVSNAVVDRLATINRDPVGTRK
jgi:hypothetical protein